MKPPLQPALRWSLFAALAAFAAALGWQRILAFDYGWHLRAGEIIAATGAVPRIDTLSLSHQGQPWVDIHWLFQLTLVALRELGGHGAVVALKSALAVALAAVTLWRGPTRSSPVLCVLCAAWMLAIACDRFIVRPEFASLLLLALSLALLERFERSERRSVRGDRWIYALVPLHALWANLHGLFAVGLAVAGIHLAARIASNVLRRDFSDTGTRHLAAATALAAAASLLNPNGLTGALFPLTAQLRMLTDPEMVASSRFVLEFIRPFSPRMPLTPLDLGAFALLAATAFAAMVANRRRLRASDPLVWGAMLFLAVLANRNVALFAVAVAPIAARNLAGALQGRQYPGVVGAALGVVLLAAATLDVVRDSFFPRFAYPRESGAGLQTQWYPEGAAAWIARERPAGPVANAMRDGGYLLAVLPPEHQVLTDGRFAGLGGEAEHALVTPADLARLDGRYRFGSVVVPYARAGYEALLRELRRNPLWIPVQLDAVSLLFVRRASLPPGNRPLDLATVALPPPGPEATRAGRRSALRAARQLYAALDRPAEALVADSALAEFERFGSDRETPPDLMRAQLLARLGRADETHIEIARLAREQPRNVWQRTTLGNLELKLGDLAAARGHYEAAVASDASYSPARERLEGLEELDRLRSSGDRAAVRRAHRRLARLALPPQALPETPRTRLRAENAVGPLLGSGLGLLALLGAKRRAGAPSLRR